VNNTARPLALFISYSHKDDDLRAKLEAHLSLLKRQNVFDVWQDRRIGAGREWEGEIDSALERANVVLLLVSSDFLASDYCYDKEMMRALQRHEQGSARVVPVIFRPCDWQSSPFGKLQALPRDGQPVIGYPNVDTALTEVAVALRAIADEMRDGAATPPAIPGIVSTEQPATAQRAKLKIGAIKLWFLEIGPFEIGWPPKMGPTRLLALIVIGAVALAGMSYRFLLKPHLDEARNLMRRAEYVSAASAIESMPEWSKALPLVAGIAAQARFGARLANGEHIRTLAPELDALRTQYPEAPDVLVFRGLKSFYVDNSPEQALEQFTQAANRDQAHVEAHFLAAGRNIDLAYASLGQGAETQARSAAAEARRLIERAVSHSPFAETLPRYANEIAELYELEGDSSGAYRDYAKLAPLQPLSALQAAFVSWRLPNATTALKLSLETTEVAVARVEKEPQEASDAEGWSFRVGATDLVDVRPKAEKICLLTWAIEISRSLQSTSDSAVFGENASPPLGGLAASPEPCGKGAVAGRTRDIVCVQVLTAQRAISPSDPRQKVLENWRATRLHCGQELQPLPVLAPHGAEAKRTVLQRRWRYERELEPA
jgi:tetratricopeptide (TPR) repeat protein